MRMIRSVVVSMSPPDEAAIEAAYRPVFRNANIPFGTKICALFFQAALPNT